MTTLVTPPSRQKAFSCSSAQIRTLERKTRSRTDSTVTQGQHEQPRSAIPARVRVAHHGSGAIIDLRFFAGCGLDYYARFRRP